MKHLLPTLTAMLLLSLQAPCRAQRGRFFIDGREATREEVLALPAQAIRSMKNAVENGQPVIRIELQPETAQAQERPEETTQEEAPQQTPAATPQDRPAGTTQEQNRLQNAAGTPKEKPAENAQKMASQQAQPTVWHDSPAGTAQEQNRQQGPEGTPKEKQGENAQKMASQQAQPTVWHDSPAGTAQGQIQQQGTAVGSEVDSEEMPTRNPAGNPLEGLRGTIRTNPAAAEKRAETPQQKAASLLRGIYEKSTLLKAGDKAADFTAAKYAGGSQSLAALRGKVVLLNFWATWCGPCLRELAPEALPKAILERFADNPDFVFLPVAYTDSQKSLDKFFASDKSQPYDYLRDCTAMDPDKAIFSRYAEQGIPRSFVIGRDGVIVLGSLGAFPEELERIAAAIEKALAQ